MRHQVTKLSANGNDLGGSQLFGRRLGFSGTPSDLLPLELGKCGYEEGSDGKMIHALTSPDICSYELAPEDLQPQLPTLQVSSNSHSTAGLDRFVAPG